MPVRRNLDTYECRHGMGYTIIKSTSQEIQAQVRYFVPLGERLEVWELSLTNLRSTTASLSIFSAVEFALWDAWDDSTNFQRNFNTAEVEVEGSVIYHKTEYRERRDHFAFFACSAALAGYDTQREAFLGPYRGWDSPQVVEEGQSTELPRSRVAAHRLTPCSPPALPRRDAPGDLRLGYHENPRDQKFAPPNSQTINKITVSPADCPAS